MRILISIYSGGPDEDKCTNLFSRFISTELSPFEIMDIVGMCECYDSRLTIGQTLSFWDMNCYSGNAFTPQMISRLKDLPNDTLQQKRVPRAPLFLRVDTEFPSDSTDAKKAGYQRPFLRETSKYEFGANNFEAITFWMASNPAAMIFIGGFLWDMCKLVVKKVCRHFGFKPAFKAKSRPMVLMVGRFYRKFEQLTHIRRDDCQIVSLKRVRPGVFSVLVRTITDEKFKVLSRATGTIESLSQIEKSQFDSETAYVL